MAQEERRLSAIMFSDIKGYSKMMGEDEGAMLRMLDRHNEIIVPIIEAHKGKILKFIGDAILSSYDSAMDAVQSGMAIQRALGEHNAGVEEKEKINIRIGIHIGDVTMKGGDVFGDGVNIAARIEPLAEAGGICISQTVYDMVKARPEIQMVNLGPRELKNIKEAVNIYKVLVDAEEAEAHREGKLKEAEAPDKNKNRSMLWVGAAVIAAILLSGGWYLMRSGDETVVLDSSKAEAASEKKDINALPRIAVLYFKNTGGKEDDEYFCDGISEDLMTDLSRISGLRVTSAKNSERYKNSNLSVEEIGQALNVDTVLEGSVRRAGNQVRINAQLIGAKDGFHLWAERFDAELDDIFAVQDEVTQKIVEALKVTLTLKEERTMTEKYKPTKEAYDLYLQGMFHLKKFSREGSMEAISSFKKSIKEDNNYALACARLARAYLHMRAESADQKWLDLSSEFAQKALFIDENLPEAHVAIADVHRHRYHYEEAESAYQKAILLQPNRAEAYIGLGMIYLQWGKYDSSLKSYQKAVELKPDDYGAWRPWHDMGQIYRVKKQYDKSVESLERAISLRPDIAWPHQRLGGVYFEMGKFDEAMSEYKKAVELDPEEPYGHLFYYLTLCRSGKTTEAEEQIKGFSKTLEGNDWINPVVRYYAGEISEDDVFQAAGHENPETDKGQKCEAFYYVGMKRLLDGDKEKAREYFEKCLATGVEDYGEYQMAQKELERM